MCSHERPEATGPVGSCRGAGQRKQEWKAPHPCQDFLPRMGSHVARSCAPLDHMSQHGMRAETGGGGGGRDVGARHPLEHAVTPPKKLTFASHPAKLGGATRCGNSALAPPWPRSCRHRRGEQAELRLLPCGPAVEAGIAQVLPQSRGDLPRAFLPGRPKGARAQGSSPPCTRSLPGLVARCLAFLHGFSPPRLLQPPALAGTRRAGAALLPRGLLAWAAQPCSSRHSPGTGSVGCWEQGKTPAKISAFLPPPPPPPPRCWAPSL